MHISPPPFRYNCLISSLYSKSGPCPQSPSPLASFSISWYRPPDIPWRLPSILIAATIRTVNLSDPKHLYPLPAFDPCKPFLYVAIGPSSRCIDSTELDPAPLGCGSRSEIWADSQQRGVDRSHSIPVYIGEGGTEADRAVISRLGSSSLRVTGWCRFLKKLNICSFSCV